jgi:uncharacterized membrane protein
MDCSAAAIDLLLLVIGILALAAMLSSRDSAARLTALTAEIERLRDLSRANAAAVARLVAEIAHLRAPHEQAAPHAPSPLALPLAPLPPLPAVSGQAAAAPPGPPSLDMADLAPSSAAAVAPQPAAAASATAAGAAGDRSATFEELVGARLQVWVGAMALALAGAFLVKISFERGWISPPVRVATGVAFGIALLALAEGLRRSSSRISEALAAAGIADLFACFLAAVHLYHLVPPAAGFLLMGLTTAVAVALALRQGIMVALVGLVGGFLTPALIQTGRPSARHLFGYLLLLIAGLLAVAWRRRWRWLAIAALASGLAWAVVWLANPLPGGDASWLSLFLVALAAGAILPPLAAGRPGRGWAAATPSLALAAAALALLAGTVSRNGYSPGEWGFLAVLAAGVLALAWFDARHLPLAWVAVVMTAAPLAAWGWELTPAEHTRFLITALAFGGLFAVAGWAAAFAGKPSWRPPRGWSSLAAERDGPAAPMVGSGGYEAPDAARGDAFAQAGQWAALSAAAGVLFFLVAWTSAHAVAGLRSETWAGLALAAAALYLAGAVPVARRRHAHAGLTPALAALAVAVTSQVSISVPLALGRESFAAAWALEVAALVWLAGRFCLPALVVLARLLAPIAVVGALLSGAEEQARSQLPLWNELLYAYGVPLLALAWAAWMARRDSPLLPRPEKPLTSPLRLAAELEWQAVALAFLLLTLEIHQLFQPAVPSPEANAAALRWDLAQHGALAGAWLLLGSALLWANRRLARRSLELAGRLVILFGLAAALFGACLADNPLWGHQVVGGTPLLNVLAIAYALPAMLAIAAAAEVRRHGGRRLPRAASAVALLLGFAWISLTVRQLFHGTFLDQAPAGAAERYAYSAAWVLYGVLLLLAGIARRGPILRFGSLAVMLLAVSKVFLYDTARLSDLYRVLSFLGLGASLLLLGFLYQRFVFRPAGSEPG